MSLIIVINVMSYTINMVVNRKNEKIKKNSTKHLLVAEALTPRRPSCIFHLDVVLVF